MQSNRAKPFAFGKLENAWFCGLPGNPVSALVTFYQLVQPLIAKLQGQKTMENLLHFSAIATMNLKKNSGTFRLPTGFYHINEQGQIEVQSVGFKVLISLVLL